MNILVCGDYVPIGRVAQDLEKSDYATIFNQIKEITEQADYSIVNLEAPIVKQQALPIEKTGPNLKCTEKAIYSIKYAGFNCVTLANNHIRDYGDTGIQDTLELCKKNQVDYVGAGRNIEDACSTLYKEIDNKKIAIINVCESEWSIATEKAYGAAPLNVVRVSRQIQEAKNKADFILLIIHGGVEHYNLPTPRMVETYRFFIDMGADAIVNHHQHCYSGYELYGNKPIFYGIGNFCFDRGIERNRRWKEGYMVSLNFEKSISFKIIPYVQSDTTTTITVLPSDAYNENIEKLNKIINSPNKLKELFTELSKKKSSFYFNTLEPFNNRYIRKFQNMNLLPKVVNRNFKKKILAITRCESHLETFLSLLKSHF